ncbi:hypothetical protein F2Q69_00012725 [Brassica cretica]|uniref:Uncharacterized protein n=1 Tax=Brassica cretica TaxID=69181 RepID=A0A8S9R3C2_BRACR|nr:hypothetical protein F2Q69_00012725 [Brassica cretica]
MRHSRKSSPPPSSTSASVCSAAEPPLAASGSPPPCSAVADGKPLPSLPIWSLFEQLEFIDTTFLLLSAMSGSMDFGVASHTSLSDFPVAHPSLFPFSGVYQFLLTLFRGYPGVIRDVFAATQVQAVVPRVLLREIMCCKLVGIAFGLGCSSLSCVDIGVTLGDSSEMELLFYDVILVMD